MSGNVWVWVGFTVAAVALVWACVLLAFAIWSDAYDQRMAEEEARLTEGLERIRVEPARVGPPMPSLNIHYQPRHGWATISDIAALRRMMYTPTQPLPFVVRRAGAQ